MAKATPTFDDCLARFPDDQRAALEKLRQQIRKIAPASEEGVSYGLAAFRLEGKPLVGLGATAKHCAFYLMSGSMVDTFQKDLTGYDTSKGTIRFLPEQPLPAALVKKLVLARIAENAALLAAKSKPKKSKLATDPEVDEFLAELDNPLKAEILEVRQWILGLDPAISEGIKWKSPSFRTTDFFATVHLRSTDSLRLILHLGAKVKQLPEGGIAITDPKGLLKWLAKDRAIVTLGSGAAFRKNLKPFEAILKQWVRALSTVE